MPINLFGFTIGRTAPTSPTGGLAPTQEPEHERPDRWNEVGASGTIVYSGFLGDDEYNSDLRGAKAIDVYNKMAKSDGMVKALLRALTLPMRTATLEAVPASDDPRDEMIARACEFALANMPGITADEFRRQAFMGAFTYGHSAFEQVYVDKDGLVNLVDFEDAQVIMPYKLAPRLQKSIYRWLIDRVGDLRGIQQRVWVGEYDENAPIEAGDTGGQMTHVSSGSFKLIDIPAERLLLFSFDREGANYLGESVLRSAYKHWYYKDNYLRMMAVGIERHLVGTPYAIVKQNIAPQERSALISVLENLRVHEKQAVLVNAAQLAGPTDVNMPPLGFLEMPTLGGNGRMVDLAIQYHDRQMALSILADFLSLGSGIGGNANVMSRDKTSYFFLALEGYAQAFTDTVERQVLAPFVEMNWPGAKVPMLKLNGLEAKNLDTLARGLAYLISAGGITADAGVQNTLRELMGLPSLPEGPDGEPVLPEPPTPPAPTNPNPSPVDPNAPKPANDPPGPNAGEAALSQRVMRLADAFGMDGATGLLTTLTSEIANRAKKVADPEGGYTVEDFVRDVTILMASAYLGSFLLGAAARAATTNGVPTGVGTAADQWAAQQVTAQMVYVQKFAAQLDASRQAQVTIAQHYASPGEAPESLIRDLLSESQIEQLAGMQAAPVWTGYQRGRVATELKPATAGGDQPKQRILWHAEGDKSTCDLCASRDGKEYTEEMLPGFPGEGTFGDLCDGGPNCRCWLEVVDI